MIEDGLRYQTQGENWVKRVLIGGGVLTVGLLFSVLLIPLIALFTFNGYMVEVMRRVMRGEKTVPPEWGNLDLVATTIDGVKQAIIALAYGLVLVLVAGIPFGLLVVLGGALDVGILSALGFLVGGLAYFVGTLVLLAVLPVATANFIVEDSVAAGFDFGVLRNLVTNRTMLMAILYGVVINILMSVVTSVLGSIFIGLPAVPFVVFVGQSAIFYVWAGGFADAYREVYGDLPTIPEGPVDAPVTGGEAGAGESFGTTASNDFGESADDEPTTPNDLAESGDDDATADESTDDDRDRWE